MICNKCGMQNNDSSKFCVSCGNTLVGMQQPVINEQSSQMNFGESIMNNLPITNNVMIQQNNSQEPNTPIINNKENKSVKSNKKLLFIIGGVVLFVIGIVVLLLFLFKGNSTSKNLSSIFDLEQPIPVYKDGGYVYIDTNGKIIKNIVYNEAEDFSGDYAYVELQDGTAALIDKNQNVKISATSYYAMENISDYNLWVIDGVLYNEKLNAITDKTLNIEYEENGFFKYNNSDYTKYGIINSEGKKIYENECRISSLEVQNESEEIEKYGILTLRCYASANDVSDVNSSEEIKKEYLIDLQNGNIIYENKYVEENQQKSYVYSLRKDSDNIYYINDLNYDRVENFYVKDGKIAYSIKESLYGLELYGENYLELDYGYNYDQIGKTQRYYYYDLKNKKLLEEKPEIEELNIELDIDETERQIVSCSNGKGLIDDKNVIIPCVYEDIDYLNDNVYEYIKQTKSMDLLIVESKSDQTIIYDAKKRKEILKLEQAKNYKIYDYSDSLFINQEVYVDDSWSRNLKKTVVYNLLTQKSLQFDADSDIDIKSNYFTESRNGKKIYYNMNFEKIYTED